MPSRILLISANRCTTPDPVFPLGLAHLSAALRRAGHRCSWFDSLADDDLEETIRRERPDFVGLSVRNIDDVQIRKRETFFDQAVSLGARLRQHARCPIIVGGSGYSIFPRRLLERIGADFGVCGEGETTVVALIAALVQGTDFSSLPGLVFRREGQVCVNAPRVMPFRAAIPVADRPASATAYYIAQGSPLNVQTQRGCGFRCCYCTYPLIEGTRHRRRPAEQVADEFESLQRQGAKYVFIVDSVFNSSPRHVTEVCTALVRRNMKLPWGCFLRPQGLTPELMRLMARAGLTHIEFGSDSFCDAVLAAYRKDFTFDDIRHAHELARRENIDCCHFLICGGPGETPETMKTSLVQSRRLCGAVVMAVAGMRIYPGTELFQRAVAEGCIRPESDLLEPAYYLAPPLSAEGVLAQLREFARQSPNWIVGDTAPAYRSLVQRLRRRGVIGPLWSYFAMIQRLWPAGSPAAATS